MGLDHCEGGRGHSARGQIRREEGALWEWGIAVGGAPVEISGSD